MGEYYALRGVSAFRQGCTLLVQPHPQRNVNPNIRARSRTVAWAALTSRPS
jgi:hypothetical protein